MNILRILIMSIPLVVATNGLAEISEDQLFQEVRPVRVVKIELYDQGILTEGSHDLAIDIIPNLCDVADQEPEPELFTDTMAGIYIYNDTDFPIQFDEIRFFIKRLNGRSFKSKKLYLASVGYVESGSTTRVLALLLQAIDGKKFLYPNRGPLPQTAGATNVKFVLKGKNVRGQSIKTVGKIALVFRDVNRCE